ncbi:hypothetical protein B0O99DRAFT_651083 [Bisporella sp. PMI_857]|nr:hypothetical protein B0O99DRAFT_651083 [Bisporella sp. PMI_857]
MPSQPPFLYNAIKTEGPGSPYSNFDPKAFSRASIVPKEPRPKQNGPLVSFNQHPDSYLILPNEGSNTKPMNPSVKSWVKWTRICQLALRCLEALASIGLLVMMILIRNVDAATGWIMRVAPGVAILHTIYAIYHLARKPSGRAPASSASYMLFAAFFDVSMIPFYAFSALVAKTKQDAWTTIISDPDKTLMPIFSTVVFYLAAVGAGLFVTSMVLSIYLAVTFRKITQMPPDMNPLEDHLTSRHKRNKSALSTSTTSTAEKRISMPLESNRSSGVAYEDLSRPPTIPFFHTRSGSTDSFSTYKSTPPPSRDARLDLPSRQYQIPASPRSSIVELKRTSNYEASLPGKRGSYSEVSLSEKASQRSPRRNAPQSGNGGKGWYTRDSLSPTRARPETPNKGYQPLHQRYDSVSDSMVDLPNPLEANPPSSRHSYRPSRDSPLSEMSINRNSTDIVDSSRIREDPQVRNLIAGDNFRYSKNYGELKPGTPPILVGGKNRQASGNDFKVLGGYKVDKRDVSGKVAEEGRGGAGSGWGARFRKVSGI